MSKLFKNASPAFIPLGANDKSKRVAPVATSGNPQHLPKFYIFAEKGPEDVEYIDPGFLNAIYGSGTFDTKKPFYNHATRFVVGGAGVGNKMMIHRVVPKDAGVRSNVAVYLDVLDTELDQYKRDSKGNLILDEFNNPVVDENKPKIKGKKIKWITDFDENIEPTQEGLLVPKAGTMEGETIVRVESDTEFEEKEVGTGEYEEVQELVTPGTTTSKAKKMTIEELRQRVGDGHSYPGHNRYLNILVTKIVHRPKVEYLIDYENEAYSNYRYIIDKVALDSGSEWYTYNEVKLKTKDGGFINWDDAVLGLDDVSILDLESDIVTEFPDGAPSSLVKAMALLSTEEAGNFSNVKEIEYVEIERNIREIIDLSEMNDDEVLKSAIIKVNKEGLEAEGVTSAQDYGFLLRYAKEIDVDGKYSVFNGEYNAEYVCPEGAGGYYIEFDSEGVISKDKLFIFLEKYPTLVTVVKYYVEKYIRNDDAVITREITADINDIGPNDRIVKIKHKPDFVNFASLGTYTKDKLIKCYCLLGGICKLNNGELASIIEVNSKINGLTFADIDTESSYVFNAELAGYTNLGTYGAIGMSYDNYRFLLKAMKDNPDLFNVEEIEYMKTVVPEPVVTEPVYKTVKKEIMKTVRIPKIVETKTKVKSRMYPIFEVRAKYRGAYYNNIGFSINTHFGEDFDTDLAKKISAYPYTLSLYKRTNPQVSPKVYRTFSGENEITTVLSNKPVTNPVLNSRIDIKKVFKDNWYNDDPASTKDYLPTEYAYFHLYEDNLNDILKSVLDTEKELISKTVETYQDGTGISLNWYDFDGSKDLDEQYKLINLFTCKTSKNVNLQSVTIANGIEDKPKLRGNLKEVNMSINRPILLEAGSDGTMTNEEFERLVQEELDKYLDKNSKVQPMSINVESAFYDTGFELETKLKFANCIALRKDTYVGLTTHRASLGTKCDGLADQRAIATAINAALKLAPESSYFGTPTARAFIVLGCGKLKDDSTDDYVPTLYDYFLKMCRFAGASNGYCNRTELFDRGDKANVTELYQLQPEFIPEGFKPLLWESQVIWAQNKDRETYYFPASQTVYEDDTSVLNSVFTLIVMSTCTKEAERAHAEFSGDSRGLSNDEFTEEIEEYMRKKLSNDRFGGVARVVSRCIIDADDAKRGFTWHTVNEISTSPMRSVMIHSSELYRLEN